MKKVISLLTISILISFQSWAQLPFDIHLEEVTGNNLPAVQSFAWAEDSVGRILIIAGRTDGLHRRQPWAAFDPADNNDQLFVIDTAGTLLASAALTDLPTDLQDQLQSTNPEFIQVDQQLVFIGGYGYRNEVNDHSTFDRAVVIDVDPLVTSLLNQQNISSHFSSISDSLFAVTGGYLGFLNDTFYLVGGQYFHGSYNPMGPTHGPGFVQEYTDAIRKFTLDISTTSPTITSRNEIHDPALLHRRDFNMAPQIFQNNQRGFTAFTGVFQPVTDLPWLNLVDIKPTGYEEVPGAQQQLNQYHTAHLSVYDELNQQNRTLFFGGMGRFYPDASGNLIDDTDVPFVTTISCISRAPNGSATETYFSEEMPGLLGSGAEFIPNTKANYDHQHILHWTGSETQPLLAGYIYGGIESTAPNIFFINDGTQSSASHRWFKVWLNPQPASEGELDIDPHHDWVRIYPNPPETELLLHFDGAGKTAKVSLIDPLGKVLYKDQFEVQGPTEIAIPLSPSYGRRYLVQIDSEDGKTFTKWIHAH